MEEQSCSINTTNGLFRQAIFACRLFGDRSFVAGSVDRE